MSWHRIKAENVCLSVFVPCWRLQALRQVSISPIITSVPLHPLPLSPRVSQYRACEGDAITPKLVSRLFNRVKKPKHKFQSFLYSSMHLIYSSLEPCLTFIFPFFVFSLTHSFHLHTFLFIFYFLHLIPFQSHFFLSNCALQSPVSSFSVCV